MSNSSTGTSPSDLILPPPKRKAPLRIAVIEHQKIAKKKNPPDFPLAGMFHTMEPVGSMARVILVFAGGRSGFPTRRPFSADADHSDAEAMVPHDLQVMASSALVGIAPGFAPQVGQASRPWRRRP